MKLPTINEEELGLLPKSAAPEKTEHRVAGAVVALCFMLSGAVASAVSSTARRAPTNFVVEDPVVGEPTPDLPSSRHVPLEPPVPGWMPGITKPRILLGADKFFPPYADLIPPATPDEDPTIGGFGPDVAAALSEVCEIEVTTIEANWDDCWGDNVIGDGTLQGWYHGCQTYTQVRGVRNRYLDFSAPILQNNKRAGFLTRLQDGSPEVSPESDLSDVTVVDIVGWAPTPDVISTLKNRCTNEFFDVDVNAGGNLVTTDDEVGCLEKYPEFCSNANDVALYMLLEGQADVVYIYADQAKFYFDACAADPIQAENCELWRQFGETFGYIHMGMDEFAIAGTTLSISKKGSGLPAILDPCIEKLLETETYATLCDKWGLTEDCFPNDFTNQTGTTPVYNVPANEQQPGCADGYCSCSDLP